MLDRMQAMEKIFSPRSVAFLGASNNRAKWGGIIFRNLRKGGFQGAIYPVNPGEKEVQGFKAYPKVSDIPGEVDLAVFTIPARLVPEAISDCVRKGVPAVALWYERQPGEPPAVLPLGAALPAPTAVPTANNHDSP